MPKIPPKVVFNVTLRCQLRCKICNINNTYSNQDELTTSEVINIMKDLSQSGIPSIDFVGGEVLIRPDIAEILKSARELFKEISVVTNGVEGRKYADLFLSLPMDYITISLDGSNQKTNDYIRGEGVFEKIIAFLDYIKLKKKRNNKPYFTINTVILKNNVSELIDILRLADSMSCNSITYEVFLYDNANLSQGSLDSPFWVKDENLPLLQKQIDRILEIKKGPGELISIGSTLFYLKSIIDYYTNNLKPNLFSCRNGIDFITVGPEGKARICDSELGNLNKENFLSIWSGENTRKALYSAANCIKPCMMNCMVGGVEQRGS